MKRKRKNPKSKRDSSTKTAHSNENEVVQEIAPEYQKPVFTVSLNEVANLNIPPKTSQEEAETMREDGESSYSKPLLTNLDCSVCEFRCGNKKEFKKHFKMHADLKDFKCSTCDIEFRKKSLWKKHIFEHTREQKVKVVPNKIPKKQLKVDLKCPHCDFVTKHRSTFNKHVNLCKTGNKLTCSQCDFTCLTRRELLKHIPVAHMDKDYKICQECGFQAASLSALENHQVTHYSNQVYECSLCVFATKYPASLERHIKFVHLNERLNHCTLCNYKAKEKSDLTKHMRVHGYSIYCPYCCEVFTRPHLFLAHPCTKKFMESQQVYECFPDSLKDMFSTSTKNFDIYLCFECTKEFENKELLNAHMMRRHPQKCSYLCWLCGQCFTVFKILRDHACRVKEKREESKPRRSKQKLLNVNNSQIFYQCSECEFQSKYVKSLYYHTTTTHKNGKSYKCISCDFKGPTKYEVRKHEISEHQLNLYTCSQCDMQFDQIGKLRNHASIEHGDTTHASDDDENLELAFKCELCDYSTTGKNRLKRHYKCVHEKIRSHSCTQCDYKAKERGDLKKHFLWVHCTVKGPYTCSECKETFPMKTQFRLHDCPHKVGRPTPRRMVRKKPQEDDKNQVKCSYCSFRTKYPKSLSRHVDCVHEGTRAYPCPKCDHKSKESGDLKRHLLSAHSISTPYFCAVCHTSYKYSMDLRNHECKPDLAESKDSINSDGVNILNVKNSNYRSLDLLAKAAQRITKIKIETPEGENSAINESTFTDDSNVESPKNLSFENSTISKENDIPMSNLPRQNAYALRILKSNNILPNSPEKPGLPTISLKNVRKSSIKRAASSQSAVSFIDESVAGKKKIRVVSLKQEPENELPDFASIQIKSEPNDPDSNETWDFVGFNEDQSVQELTHVMHEISAYENATENSDHFAGEVPEYESETEAGDHSIPRKAYNPVNNESDKMIYDFSTQTVMHEVTIGDDSEVSDCETVDYLEGDRGESEQLDSEMPEAIVLDEPEAEKGVIVSSAGKNSDGKPQAKNKIKVIKIKEEKNKGLSCLGCNFFCESLNELVVHLRNH